MIGLQGNERLEWEAGEVSQMDQLIEDNLETLEEYFIEQGEYDGIAITKDNVESQFERWLEDLDLQTLIEIIY